MPSRSSGSDGGRGAETYLDVVMSIWAERGSTTTSVLTGNSMAPFLWHGDQVVIEHGTTDLRLGDVIVYTKDGKVLAHRLVGRRRSRDGEPVLLTKGDRSRVLDPAIRHSQVIGKVIEVRGTTGHRRLTSPFWMIANYLLAGLSRLRVAFARPQRAVQRAVTELEE